MKRLFLVASACLSMAALSSPVSAREYPTDPNAYRISQPDWTVCQTSFYAYQASGDPHAGETALQLWTEPFKPSGPIQMQMYYSSYGGYQKLTGELFDEYAAFLSQHLNRTDEFFSANECRTFKTREEAVAATAEEMRKSVRNTSIVPAPSKAMLDRAVRKLAGKPELAGKKDAKEPAKSTAPAKDLVEKPETPKGPTAAELAAERHRAVEERNRLAREAYEAKLAEQKKQVEAFERAKEEVARKKAAQAVAAAEVLSDYEAKRAASDELLRRHDAEQRRHNACIQGNQQACADIAAGKPIDAQLADAGKASTDTDANQCVTSPELRENDTFKGNTAAYVVNGCAKPVDVRTCLKRASGQWNCGMTSGLAPQARWSHSSFDATGQVFVDARTSGSGKPLAMPN